jgi:hypothetical protein
VIVNQVVEMPRAVAAQQTGRMSVAEVTQHAIAVQEIMQAVMKEGEHYGKIPGTDKPTLYKAGAEKLCMTFRIADEYKVEDLSTSDVIRYRVVCVGRHQLSGIELGSGMGEGSTGEEKYRWRKAVCKEEFDATPAAMRRTKYGKKSGGFYTVEQVRTEPSDLANTVLKMACKRAKMAMVLNVTAASDCFTQDLEDLDTVLAQHLTEQEQTGDPELRDEWVAKANAALTKEVLEQTWKLGVAEIQKAKDKPAYDAFKAAVQAKGAALTAAPAETGSGASA